MKSEWTTKYNQPGDTGRFLYISAHGPTGVAEPSWGFAMKVFHSSPDFHTNLLRFRLLKKINLHTSTSFVFFCRFVKFNLFLAQMFGMPCVKC